METVKRKMELRIRKGKGAAISSDLYEWTVGNKRWYWISRRSMEIEGSAEQQRNLFNALLIGLVATVEKGAYNRKLKRLTLEL